MDDGLCQRRDSPIFDFFEVDERPVIINRNSDMGWVWRLGAWQEDNSLIRRCYTQGRSFSQEAFVRRFPYAALALLDPQQPL